MAATATVKAADPATERRAVLDRVLARARPPEGSTRWTPGPGDVRTEARVAGAERLPAADLGEWIDDRIVACFGSRVRLNPVEAVAYGILQAMRPGDAAGIAAAVDPQGRRPGRAGAALGVAAAGALAGRGTRRSRQDDGAAALTEARQLGWDVRPYRRALEKDARSRAAAAPRADLDAGPGRALSPGAEKLLGKRTAAA